MCEPCRRYELIESCDSESGKDSIDPQDGKPYFTKDYQWYCEGVTGHEGPHRAYDPDTDHSHFNGCKDNCCFIVWWRRRNDRPRRDPCIYGHTISEEDNIVDALSGIV